MKIIRRKDSRQSDSYVFVGDFTVLFGHSQFILEFFDLRLLFFAHVLESVIFFVKSNVFIDDLCFVRGFLELIVSDDLVDVEGIFTYFSKHLLIEDIAQDKVVLVHHFGDLRDRTHQEVRIVYPIEDDRFKNEWFLFVDLSQCEELAWTTDVFLLYFMKFVNVLRERILLLMFLEVLFKIILILLSNRRISKQKRWSSSYENDKSLTSNWYGALQNSLFPSAR